MAGQYDSPIWRFGPHTVGLRNSFLDPYQRLHIRALAGLYGDIIPTRFLAPIDCSKISAQYGLYQLAGLRQ